MYHFSKRPGVGHKRGVSISLFKKKRNFDHIFHVIAPLVVRSVCHLDDQRATRLR